MGTERGQQSFLTSYKEVGVEGVETTSNKVLMGIKMRTFLVDLRNREIMVTLYRFWFCRFKVQFCLLYFFLKYLFSFVCTYS